MLPVVAIAAASAAMQYYQSEKARGASEDRLKQLERDFNALIPPEYDISIMDPPEYLTEKIPEPSFDMSTVTPEQFKLVGKYTPDVAPQILEQRPELAKETGNAREGREAQLNALRKLKGIAAQDSDPELAEQLAKAGRGSQIEAQSRSQSLLQDMARRGTLSSGMGLAAQLQGSSDAMQRGAQQSQAAASEAYRNRLSALRDSAQLGGQVRGEDMAQENRNAGVINDFNERTSRNAQMWANQRSDAANDAQRMNLGAEQRVNDQNVSGRNRAGEMARERQDALQKYRYQNQVGEQGRQNDIIGKQADWRRDERSNQNSLKSRAYGDQLQKQAGKAGIASQYNALDQQRAQDRNSMVQGIGNAAAGAYGAYQQGAQQDQMQDRADRRARFEQTGAWEAPEVEDDEEDLRAANRRKYAGRTV